MSAAAGSTAGLVYMAAVLLPGAAALPIMVSLPIMSSLPLDSCRDISVDFIIKENHPHMAIVEDDIVQDLAKIGVKVNTRVLNSSAYGEAEKSGDFDMMLGSTWGAPYEPHTYLSSWKVPAHPEYAATRALEPPLTQTDLLAKIEDVMVQSDQRVIAEKYELILQEIHSQAIFLPLWGSRIPYVLNRRLGGFTLPTQTYAYPLESVSIYSGSANVTIAPGAGGSLFRSVGPVNPHQYYPNQLFAQSWVYQGLVGYGQDGEINPVLAKSWVIDDLPSGGRRYTFTLREGVKFHDGSDWNCAVAKLNFDHVLSDTVKQRHAWLPAIAQLTSWTCSDAGEFVLETKDQFYPLLQELTYIRPLTFAAASAFAEGLDSHPDQHNSCQSGASGYSEIQDTITCAGLKAPLGTGPFKLVKQTTEDGIDTMAIFARHDDYWGGAPQIEFLHLKYYASNEDVNSALLSGELDMALGIGPLTAQQVQTLKFHHSDKLDVRHSGVMNNAFAIMNSNGKHTNDIKLRRAIIHAIDKSRFIKEEFAGLEQPVSQLFPYTTPYCNVDLSPKWAYDFEKAQLLNCPTSDDDDDLPTWAIGVIATACVLFVAAVSVIGFMYFREKAGNPVFKTLENKPGCPPTFCAKENI